MDFKKLKIAYLSAKLGADTAENESHFGNKFSLSLTEYWRSFAAREAPRTAARGLAVAAAHELLLLSRQTEAALEVRSKDTSE